MSRTPINHPVSAWATETINEICEDIALVGAKTTAYLILNGKGEIIDYDVENAALTTEKPPRQCLSSTCFVRSLRRKKTLFTGVPFRPVRCG